MYLCLKFLNFGVLFFKHKITNFRELLFYYKKKFKQLHLKDYTLNTVQEVIKGVTFFILPIMIDGLTNDETLDALSDDLDKNNIENSSRYVLLLRHTDELRKNIIVHEAAHTLGLTHTYREEGNDIEPKVFFRKDETKNIMDKGKKFKDNNLFWKWQWETMIKDSDLKPIDNE